MTEQSRVTWEKDGTLTHIGQPDWLSDAFLITLMTAFEDAGFQIYAVGGCVRDTVLESFEKPASSRVHDIDLSTNARPNDTIRIIENLTHHGKPWKAVPTGIEHGTITAVSPERTYEITTFRKDVETDGRHAVVAFSDRIEDDAMRRDFTINAFYVDRTGHVKDIVGGSLDLKDRRIRFIGDPAARIQEDYLRILRFFRFTATHGNRDDGIDADGLAACAMLADGLDGISRERIGAEMSRLIMDADPAPIIGSMEQSGVLNRVLPGATVMTLARLVDLEDHFAADDRTSPPRDLATRLASLGCADVADRLRLSNADTKKIGLVLTQAGATTPPHELGFRFGNGPAIQCMLLRWASLLQPIDALVLDDIRRGADAIFPVGAADLMPTYTGKALGDRLKLLEAAWIKSNFETTKPALLALP